MNKLMLNNKNIFLTGGTGFIGKVFLNKLLTICPNVGKIYLLVRPKKGISPENRLNDLFTNSLVFNNLRNSNTDYLNFIKTKVKLVEGDLCHSDMGLSSNDCLMLKEKANIVVNLGANVSWKESVKQILTNNLTSLADIIRLSKNSNVEHVIHVSTMGVPFMENQVNNHFGKNFNFDEYIKKLSLMNENEVDNESKRIQKLFGNTYTFAKLGSERLLEKDRGNFTTSIVRGPSIGAALYEPTPGWLDTLTGYTGVYFYLATCKSKAYLVNGKVYLNEYPVDIFSNYLLAVADNNTTQGHHKLYNLPPLDKLTLYEAMRIAETYFYRHPPHERGRYVKPLFFNNREAYNIYIAEEKQKELTDEQRHRLEKTIYFNELYRFANNNLVLNDSIKIDFKETEQLKQNNTNNEQLILKPKHFNYPEYIKISCEGINKYYLSKTKE
jgi:fatty acyl-CoA reductase